MRTCARNFLWRLDPVLLDVVSEALGPDERAVAVLPVAERRLAADAAVGGAKIVFDEGRRAQILEDLGSLGGIAAPIDERGRVR